MPSQEVASSLDLGAGLKIAFIYVSVHKTGESRSEQTSSCDVISHSPFLTAKTSYNKLPPAKADPLSDILLGYLVAISYMFATSSDATLLADCELEFIFLL